MITAHVIGETRHPATDPRPVLWWSVTKTAVATAALRLVERGQLTLDANLVNAPYTLRQLLQHTAGVPNYGGLAAYHAAVEAGDHPWSVTQLLGRVNVENLDFAPGAGWNYSNVGYLLVRRLIEQTTGGSLNTALQDLVFAPLGVTAAIAETPADLDDTAWGNANRYHPHWVYHGLLVGAADQAAAFMHGVLTGRLLTPESLQQMTAVHPLGDRPVPGRPWLTTGYGLGLMIGDVALGDGGRTLAQGHSGCGPGTSCAVYHFPSAREPTTFAAFNDAETEYPAENMVARQASQMPLST